MNKARRFRIWQRDGGLCGICGRPVAFDRGMHVDHIHPWALGGSNNLANLRAAHAGCNLRREKPHLAKDKRRIRTSRLVTDGKKTQMTFKLSPQEVRSLHSIVEATGELYSPLVRRLLHEEYERLAVAVLPRQPAGEG